ncbi:MAG: sulfotransferase [Anaerolineae bacterium]
MPGEFLGEGLIFIISQPRAGSTLLQRMLSGHPDIATAAEPWLLLHPLYGLRQHGIQAEYNSQWAFKAVRAFLAEHADGAETYRDGLRAFAATVYGAALARQGKRIFLDKTPRYYFIIPELRTLFPQASVILLLRNPLAVLHSILTTWVKGDWPRLAQHAADLRVAPVRIADAIQTQGDAAIVVRYEDLATEPQACLAGLCERLGLAPHAEMLTYGQRAAPSGRLGDQSGIQQHDRPVPDHLTEWQALAGDAQTRHFARAYLDELGEATLDRLGYPQDELAAALTGRDQVSWLSPLAPWNVVLRPASTWTRRERWQVARAQAVQAAGPWRGAWNFLRSRVPV